MPDAWRAHAMSGLDTGEARLQRWWNLFGDPTLMRLIEQARTANPSQRVPDPSKWEDSIAIQQSPNRELQPKLQCPMHPRLTQRIRSRNRRNLRVGAGRDRRAYPGPGSLHKARPVPTDVIQVARWCRTGSRRALRPTTSRHRSLGRRQRAPCRFPSPGAQDPSRPPPACRQPRSA